MRDAARQREPGRHGRARQRLRCQVLRGRREAQGGQPAECSSAGRAGMCQRGHAPCWCYPGTREGPSCSRRIDPSGRALQESGCRCGGILLGSSLDSGGVSGHVGCCTACAAPCSIHNRPGMPQCSSRLAPLAANWKPSSSASASSSSSLPLSKSSTDTWASLASWCCLGVSVRNK